MKIKITIISIIYYFLIAEACSYYCKRILRGKKCNIKVYVQYIVLNTAVALGWGTRKGRGIELLGERIFLYSIKIKMIISFSWRLRANIWNRFYNACLPKYIYKLYIQVIYTIYIHYKRMRCLIGILWKWSWDEKFENLFHRGSISIQAICQRILSETNLRN